MSAVRGGTIRLPLIVAGTFLLAACAIAQGNDLDGRSAAPPASRWIDVSATHLPQGAWLGASMEARAADLDGDGDLDLLIAKEKRLNVLLLNDGHGRFTDASDRLPRTRHDSEDIAVGDFDGDGDLDAVLASEDDAVPEYYVNDGGARFSDADARLPLRAVCNAVAAGDVDGDGDLDLVFGCDGAEHVMMNDGHGTFSDETFGPLAAARDVTQDVALGDVDRDGDLDLLVGNEDGNRLYLNTRGVFVDATGRIPPPPAPEETRNADLADVDGDGDLDAFFSNVTFSGKDPQGRLLLNDGQGRFTDATAARLPRMTWSTMDGDFADVDRDGDLDLVTTSIPDGGRPRVYRNDGRGNFTEASDAWFPHELRAEGIEVEVADFDGDGRLDVYLANYRGPDRLLLA
ncbi:MAG TPA: VCBS repeat-containing protein, partial [Longimicrobiaceae bacterium]|nr:VCBS repeat-containing protein [Longimicrobiaceae bacterium]